MATSPGRAAPALRGAAAAGGPLAGCGSAHTGPARGAPWPRRNHGFAPRLQSGAEGEAILSGAPVPVAEDKGGCARLASRAGPRARLRELPAETVTSPAYPTPAPVRWLPRRRRRRRALPVSGSAVTRAALAPPQATSPAPRAGPALSFDQTKGPRDVAEPPGPGAGAPGWRAEGGGDGHKAAFVRPRPARCGGRTRPRPPPGSGRTARATWDSAGTRRPVTPAANRYPQP